MCRTERRKGRYDGRLTACDMQRRRHVSTAHHLDQKSVHVHHTVGVAFQKTEVFTGPALTKSLMSLRKINPKTA